MKIMSNEFICLAYAIYCAEKGKKRKMEEVVKYYNL